MAKFNFRESYINAWWQSFQDKFNLLTFLISLPLSIVAFLNYFKFHWIKEEQWNMVTLIIPVVILALCLFVATPYFVWKKQNEKIQELEDAVKRTNKLSERVRADISHLRDTKVLNIPNTLRKIHKQIRKVAETQVREGIDKLVMRRVILDLLETYEVDTTDLYDMLQDNLEGNLEDINDKRLKKKLVRLMRGTEKAFNIRPTDKTSKTKLVTLLTNLEGVLRKRNMSIEQYCEHNGQYNNLIKELEDERDRATDKLSLAIDEVLLYINGFGNMVLVSLYTQTDYSDLKVFHTLRWKKYNIARFSYYRLFSTLINELIGRVSKYGDEYIVGID